MKRYKCGDSIKGASHVKNGSGCQDSFAFSPICDQTDKITIVAVADGHGSEKCPRSKSGSQIAVNTFCKVMGIYLKNFCKNLLELITYLNREGDTRFAQEICEEWQERVRESFYKNKDNAYIGKDGKYDWEGVYKLYGTTLLGVLIMDSFVFAFQIGDGDIMFVDKNGVSPVLEAEKFLGTETHSLSKTDAWKHAVSKIIIRNIEDDRPYMYMLTTDGFVNSHVSEEEFYKTCQSYFDLIQEKGFDVVRDNLKKWLTETSYEGCGDDITATITYFE